MSRLPFNNRQLFLLSCLRQRSHMTAKELAFKANVSERTIKSDLAQLKLQLKDAPFTIASKSGEGYTLLVRDSTATASFFQDIRGYSQMIALARNDYERSNYIVKRLLLARGYVKMETLADEMFVSRSTVNLNLKEVRQLLANYHLSLQTRPNYGLRLEGQELDLRLCFSSFFYHNNLSLIRTSLDEGYQSVLGDTDLSGVLAHDLRSCCEEHRLYLSDFSYQNITSHTLIMLSRNKLGWSLSKDEIDAAGPIGSSALRCAEGFARCLEQHLFQAIPETEVRYLALHIDSKQIRTAYQRSEEIDRLLDKIYAAIWGNFDIDLSGDEMLSQYLALHIPQMVDRIRRGLTIRNPMAFENFRNCMFGLKVTVTAAVPIEEYYQVEIGPDEFGYLLIYFHTALLSIRRDTPVRIGYLSGRGRSESLLYSSELRRHFPEDGFEIATYDSVRQIRSFPSAPDILVTLSPIHLEGIKHTVTIGDGDYLKKIQSAANQVRLQALNFDKYFKPQYFVAHLPGSNRQEVIREVYDYLSRIDVLYDKPRVSPEFTAHELGNGAVHLQDLWKYIHTAICFVGVLEKPIIWDKTVVRFVFVIKTKRDGDLDLYTLCELFSHYVSNVDLVNRLLDHRSFTSFLHDIRE